MLDVPGDRSDGGVEIQGAGGDRVRPRQSGPPGRTSDSGRAHSRLVCDGVRSYADSAYYTHGGGAGVFNTGTMRWVESFGKPVRRVITRACRRFTCRVTANVLEAFADGPAAARYPAHDNLDAMQAWPGDPIAARHDLWQ